jgi:hypothetical protein
MDDKRDIRTNNTEMKRIIAGYYDIYTKNLITLKKWTNYWTQKLRFNHEQIGNLNRLIISNKINSIAKFSHQILVKDQIALLLSSSNYLKKNNYKFSLNYSKRI